MVFSSMLYRHKIYEAIPKTDLWGLCTMDREFTLHMANPGSILIISYGPQALPGVIPECKARSKPNATMSMPHPK